MLKLDSTKTPSVTILVPTYNEEKIIKFKLENLARIDYPKELTRIIMIDSASTDGSMSEIKRFIDSHPRMNIEVILEEKRRGKSHALNEGLKRSKSDVVIVSDADCFWPSNILRKALPYLADPAIGAVAGQEKLLNPDESWVTKTEAIFRDKMFQVQLGESKLHSTIQFEGGFGAYKRNALEEFDEETGSDDSGTALNVVQKNVRTIVVPEATFFTKFPTSWKGKFNIKIRRTQQFLRIWIKCIRLLAKKELVLPKRIVLPQTFLFFVSPIIFMAIILTTPVILYQFPLLILPIIVAVIIPKSRIYLTEVFQTNLTLLLALTSVAAKKNYIVWKISEDSRNIEPELLTEKNLI